MGTGISDLIDDIRVVLRTMRRSPGFVVTAVIVLALGSAITGAVFSTVNGWLSVGKAIPNAERLVVVAPTENGAGDPSAYFRESSYGRLFELKLRTLQGLFAAQPIPAILALDDLSVNVRMEAVTGMYFHAVGVSPLLGRPLQPNDDQTGRGVAIVLGEGAWRRVFNGDPGVIGRSIRVSGLPCTIVGVMPASVRGFSIPTTTTVDVWAPMAAVRSLVSPSGKPVWAQVFGRLAEGASFRQAEAEMRVAGTRFDPDNFQLGAALFPVERGVMPGRVRLGLQVVGAGAVALSTLVLLIACANLANLLLARSASRSAELAVRMALGAKPSRVLRLQLLETAFVTALGGAAGFVLVNWLSRAGGRFTIELDRSTGVGTVLVDAWVLGYFFVVIAVASVAVGILPAMRAIRIDPARILTSSGARGRTTLTFERKRTLLVASQVAASTVLVIVAGLFVRSALRASDYTVAFDARHLAIGYFDFAALRWTEPEGRTRQEMLLTVGRSVPGARSAALSTGLPAAGGGELVAIEAEDAPLAKSEDGPPCRYLSVSPGFFDAIGPLQLRGRDFTAADSRVGRGVAIVNEVAAARLWPQRDPLGRSVRIRKGNPLEVVGVVPATDPTAREAGDRCYVFVPMAQRYTQHFMLTVAGATPAPSLLRGLSETLGRAMPEASMFGVKTAETYLNRSGGPSRSVAAALVVLGAVGLTIAIVGLYGVMSYVVGLRRAEFGIRKVLGATDVEIYLLVSKEACRMVGLGILAGLPIAYGISLSIRGALVGITPHDPLTYIGVPTCLAVIGVLAAWWPARQAARVEPAIALRDL
jgi:predicted permease